MRADLEIIQEWIPAGSRVLDLGCGNGELLAWLAEHKQVSGYGLEIDAPQGHDAFLIPIPRYLQAFSAYMHRISV